MPQPRLDSEYIPLSPIKISIITASYNYADTLPGCLASVAAQTYPDREHIVIDGASTDATSDILDAHRAQLAVGISEPDSGIYEALNKGIEHATGDVIGFLHADDLYANETVLARIARAFENPDIQAVYGDLVYVYRSRPDRVLRDWHPGVFRRARLACGWMPPHPTLYLRSEVYRRQGLFDPTYRIAGDYDFMLRIFSRLKEEQVAYIPETFVRMRSGGTSSRSLRDILRKSAEDYRALRRNRIGGIATLAWKNLSKLPQFLRR